MTSNTNPEIDDDIKAELMEAFSDLYLDIEETLAQLKHGESQEDLNSLFRHIHTIKGNAAIVQLHQVVNYTHALEEVMGCLRSRKYALTTPLSDIVHVAVDRLRDLHLRELYNDHFENLYENELTACFVDLAQADEYQVNEICLRTLNDIIDGVTPEIHENPSPLTVPQTTNLECFTAPTNLSQQKFDLIFFKDLAKQVDGRSQYWQGRSEAIHDWALKMNALRGTAVDPTQLSAAAYMHDVGMTFIPSTILAKKGTLTEDEITQIKQHPVLGYNFLIRIPGWNEAATIVLEHHERIDATGYPLGNNGAIIHEGAKILAIIDAFFSIINGRADRTHRKSMVRAVSELNARVGTQFDESWVETFNEMLRNELRSGAF